jgi:hypothetical protein
VKEPQMGTFRNPPSRKCVHIFNQRELSDLTLAVATINSWNRLSISARLVPGTYQPAKRPEVMKEA